jgi:hypothetical protein
MHISKYNTTGTKHKYSINARLIFDGGLISVKEVEWDLIKTVEDLLRKLSTRVMDLKEERIDGRKRIQ